MQKIITLAILCAFFSVNASALTLPTKSASGRSNLLTQKWPNNDAMTLLIKKNEYEDGKYWAVLAEYNRVPLTNFSVRSTITSWVPRLYVYEVTQTGAKTFSLLPLKVDSNDEIVADTEASASSLVVKDEKSLVGSSLVRTNVKTGAIEEVIEFSGLASSTWEDYVVGVFQWSHKTNGADYFNKRYNSQLTRDRKAIFATEAVQGEYDINESQPGLFTLIPTSNSSGQELVTKRIGVFIDVVNWKPVFNTEEFFLINPDDPRDVGFFYERNNKKAK